ncbi:MAG: hypothetical protein FWG30_10340 [Eubacteriaceae bacterium]|nr:hypothetical protein [Eubacteriaceae bacterium]
MPVVVLAMLCFLELVAVLLCLLDVERLEAALLVVVLLVEALLVGAFAAFEVVLFDEALLVVLFAGLDAVELVFLAEPAFGFEVFMFTFPRKYLLYACILR